MHNGLSTYQIKYGVRPHFSPTAPILHNIQLSNSGQNNIITSEIAIKPLLLFLWCPAAFGDFRKKNCLNARGFGREYHRSCSRYGPGRSIKRHGKSF